MLQAELKVIEGKQQGKSIPLSVKKFLIGRRHHCVFTQDDYTLRLRDLGSTNGTFVNGERIQGQVVLNDGDRVQIGKLAFQVTIRQLAGAASPTGIANGSLSLDDLSSQPDTAEDSASAKVDALSDSALLRSSETEVNTGKTDAGMMDSGKTIEIPAFDAASFAAAETEAGMFGGDTTVIAPPSPAQQPVSPLGPPPGRGPGVRPMPGQGTPAGGYPAQMPVGPPMGYPAQQYAPAYPPAQPMYAPPPMYPANPYGQPNYPGMGGYPGQPVYQQPAYQQPGYPPMPGYPAMPYPQAPAPAPPPAAPIETPSTAGKRNQVANQPVSLPPPESTGAKAPEPKPEEVKAADGSSPPTSKKPSSAAADIIRAHMQRRPNTNG